MRRKVLAKIGIEINTITDELRELEILDAELTAIRQKIDDCQLMLRNHQARLFLIQSQRESSSTNG